MLRQTAKVQIMNYDECKFTMGEIFLYQRILLHAYDSVIYMPQGDHVIMNKMLHRPMCVETKIANKAISANINNYSDAHLLLWGIFYFARPTKISNKNLTQTHAHASADIAVSHQVI